MVNGLNAFKAFKDLKVKRYLDLPFSFPNNDDKLDLTFTFTRFEIIKRQILFKHFFSLFC